MDGKPKRGSATEQIAPRRRVPLSDGTTAANIKAADLKSAKKADTAFELDNAIPISQLRGREGSTRTLSDAVRSKDRHNTRASNEATSSNKRNSATSAASTNASAAGRTRKTHIGPWRLGATVGKGGTARVRKVKHAVTGQVGVAKIIPAATAERARAISLANLVHSAEEGDPTLHSDKAIPLGLEREIAIMKLLKHPNIVRLYDVWENRNEIYVIMEYVQGGELFDYIAGQQRLQEDVTVYLFRQIILALKYCHGLHIHHRDLKPENILLDYETMTVKLVDFGMAALQPAGNFLTTPCGSPHYAAPELLRNLPYDGGQADVWSVGVVLFVMLTGYPPFNFPTDTRGVINEDHKLKGLFQAISRADYTMPSALSSDAQDLIRRIFVPDPSKRINIDEVWAHPFIHRYDHVWGPEVIEPSDSMMALAAAQDDWKPLKPELIDRDILRALRTLWHSENDTVLIEKLCNASFNQEKFFYHTMLCYRRDNLEDLHTAQSFGYSASDYQHNNRASLVPPMPKDALPRTAIPVSKIKPIKSEYSITGDEHLLSKHSYYDLPASEASYDPFRASHSPIVTPKSEYTNITIHRFGSKISKRHISRTSRGDSLRVGVLRGHSRQGSRISSKHSSGSNSVRRRAVEKRSSRSSSSRLSIASSHLPSGSPLPTIRPNAMHKRGVQFQHLYRNSIGNRSPDLPEAPPSCKAQSHRVRTFSKLAPAHSSPHLSAVPHTAMDTIKLRRKGLSTLATPQVRKLRECADIEARKVSLELGKACDEAFWRSSVSSSFENSSSRELSVERPFAETPPSSIPRSSPHFRTERPTSISDALRNRPLPPTPAATMSTLLPSETPATYTTRELAEMRERLATKYARDGSGNQKYFNDVLCQLDRLMMPLDRPDPRSDSRRTVSAPPDCHCPQASIDMEGLDVVQEECDERGGRQQENFATQVPGSKRAGYSKVIDEGTIRVVAPSPPTGFGSRPTRTYDATTPTPWPPLNIKKFSTSTKDSSTSTSGNMETFRSSPHHIRNRGRTVSNSYPLSSGLSPTIFQENTIMLQPRQFDPFHDQYPRARKRLPPIGCPARHSSLLTFAEHICTSSDCVSQGVGCVHPDEFALARGVEESSSTLSDIPESHEADFSKDYHNGSFGATTHAPASDGINIVRDFDLDDRAKTREQREKEKKGPTKQPGFKGFLKGLGKTIVSSKTKSPLHSALPSEPEDCTVFGDLQVHRTHDGQKDISAEMEIARFVSGFKKFVREFGYWPFMKPLIHVVPVFVSRSGVWDALRTKVDDASGFKVLARDLQKYTTTVKCDSRKIQQILFDCTVDVEIFGVSQRGKPVKNLSVVRLVQVAGPGRSFAAIAHEIEVFLDGKKMIVKDKTQAGELKSTLYKGLGLNMPYMPRPSFDI